jgi:hypothetical protein
MNQLEWTVVELVAQTMGRTGPIDLAQGEISWAEVLVIALLWAGVSAVVAIVSANYGMRWRAWGWTVSFLVFALVAAYGVWRLV